MLRIIPGQHACRQPRELQPLSIPDHQDVHPAVSRVGSRRHRDSATRRRAIGQHQIQRPDSPGLPFARCYLQIPCGVLPPELRSGSEVGEWPPRNLHLVGEAFMEFTGESPGDRVQNHAGRRVVQLHLHDVQGPA